LDQLKSHGFAGIQNFPAVGIIEGAFRANLEETGMGYGLEADLFGSLPARTCRQRLLSLTLTKRGQWLGPAPTSLFAIWA
jgi:predicted TIM-barrel enzyme